MKLTRQSENSPRTPPQMVGRVTPCAPLEDQLCLGAQGRTRAIRRQGAVSPRSAAAFTMIEIAISLAIIGFALVAIIGILPFGMGVQKDNRHETIINQDASIFLSALRGGEQGVDDLTNYVFAITNYTTQFNRRGVPTSAAPSA